MPFKRGGVSWAGRVRAGRAAVNRPDLSRYTDDTPDPPPPRRDLTDWPAIPRQHPTWWHVERVELHNGDRCFVLIAECETERAAFEVAARQRSQVRIVRWGDRKPFFSLRDPLVVDTGGDDEC